MGEWFRYLRQMRYLDDVTRPMSAHQLIGGCKNIALEYIKIHQNYLTENNLYQLNDDALQQV